MTVTWSWPDLACAGVAWAQLMLGASYVLEKYRNRTERRHTAASIVTDLIAEPGANLRQPGGDSLLSQILASPPVSPLPSATQQDPVWIAAPAEEGEEDDVRLRIVAALFVVDLALQGIGSI